MSVSPESGVGAPAAGAPVLAGRLDFTLPDFSRFAWVGDAARLRWEPRLERIRLAWSDMEWLSVVDGVRSCALVGLSPEMLSAAIPRWTKLGLSAVAVPMGQQQAHRGMTFAAVGGLADVIRARSAWAAHENGVIGGLFGYPECCRDFFSDVWVGQRCIDTTWAMAAGTREPTDRVVEIGPGDSDLANILWRWAGVRAVPHLPCRFDCAASAEFGERMLRVGERAGFSEEVGWIRQILSWPAEWSALHGIAEIKTPILKISTRTDATAGKHVVRWTGSAYPDEGAKGIRFPYRTPSRRTLSEGRRAEAPPGVPGAPARADWHHLDNGFSSAEAMGKWHQPLVALARRRLDGAQGAVLDLGCGNGVLLSKICEAREGLSPHGLDRNEAALGHARELLPRFSGNFRAGDMFDCSAWEGGPRFVLTILMLGRLLEVERPAADRLMKAVLERSDAVLAYLYPGPGTRTLESVAAEMGLTLREPVEGYAAFLVKA
jgi:SAM-dependent methyltransferase